MPSSYGEGRPEAVRNTVDCSPVAGAVPAPRGLRHQFREGEQAVGLRRWRVSSGRSNRTR